jgi:hypothetical protein
MFGGGSDSLNGLINDALKIEQITGAAPTAIALFYTICSGLASTLVMLYAMWEINTSWATLGEVSPRAVAFPLIKCGIALTLLNNDTTIMNGLTNLYNSKIAVTKTTITGTLSSKEVMDAVESQSLGFLLIFALIVLIAWAVGQVVKFCYLYKAYIIKLEAYVRMAAMPLALADSFNGLSSNSVRYLKGTIGFIAYAFIFAKMPSIIGEMAGTGFLDALSASGKSILELVEDLIRPLMLPIAGLGALGAIRQTIRDATA